MTKKTSTKSKKKSTGGTGQMGWSDWLTDTSVSSAPPAAPASLKTRDWSRLQFPRSPNAEAALPGASETVTERAMATAEVAADHGKEDQDKSRKAEPAVLTVSALNKRIRGLLESEFSLVWLKGEISNFKAHPSGHFYFSLKDTSAQIGAVMFRGFNSTLRFKPEDGMEVVVRGKITVYEPRGNYQIMCETMEPVGAGALQKAFEQLKRKLEAEGLFAPERKRPIPLLPMHIAIVTSPSGAAIRDMLNVLKRRYRSAQITVVPCAVQGERASGEIVSALRLANELRDVDVIIAGRGGGSIEDLWAFNEEAVARAIAASRVPVISAVGHEIDFTIADFVADLRAPTPSAAAELVAKSASEVLDSVVTRERALAVAVRSRINRLADRVRTANRLLTDPRRSIQDAILRCDELAERLERSFWDGLDRLEMALSLARERLAVKVQSSVDRKRDRLGRAAAVLDSVSPLRVLDRGYAVATVGGRVITDPLQVKPDTDFEVRVAKGVIHARAVSARKREE